MLDNSYLKAEGVDDVSRGKPKAKDLRGDDYVVQYGVSPHLLTNIHPPLAMTVVIANSREGERQFWGLRTIVTEFHPLRRV